MVDRIDLSIVEVSKARPEDAAQLREIAMRSKASWGYSSGFMEACRDELRVPDEWIAAEDVFTAKIQDRPVGFFSFLALPGGETELCHFFVEPDFIGCGVGRRMFEEASRIARRRGHRRIQIQSDPYAEGFYLRMGARRSGTMESLSLKGRHLPLLVFDLNGEPFLSIRGSATGSGRSA